MSNLKWEVQRFQQLTVDQLFEILQLRVEVFVVEQQCAYPELDGFDRDAETRHLSGRDEGEQLIAYARILPPGLRYPEINLGRFVVKAEVRGQGIGHQLLRTALHIYTNVGLEVPSELARKNIFKDFMRSIVLHEYRMCTLKTASLML